MKEKRLENARICPKGDIEANWNKAIGFVPKDKEIIIYKADAAHPVARFKIGDGVTAVQDLDFSGADMVAIEQLVNEKGELLIEYVDNAVDTIVQILDNKLDKSGGTVSGDLSIQGNLNVTGTTTTKDTETVLIKDNVIVANSDGNELLEEAGFAVKTGAAAAYGIMYDPVGDGVKIGLGAFDENGKFEYVEGEDQFLATRDDEITDGNLVKWNDTEKKLVDAGNEYVKFTDYATTDKAGVVKQGKPYGFIVTSIGAPCGDAWRKDEYDSKSVAAFLSKGSFENIKDVYVKDGLVTNEEEWTVEEKASACETIGAVKKYDNPNNLDRAYVAQGKNEGDDTIPISVNADNNTLALRTETGGIKVKTSSIDNAYSVVNREYANNNFIAKPSITSAGDVVVLYDTNRNETAYRSVRYSDNAQPKSFAFSLSDANGAVAVGTPTEDYHAANKQYVEDNFVAKKTAATGFTKVYAFNANGNQTELIVDPTLSGAQNNRIPMRGTNGMIYIPDKSITHPQAATNKKFVEDLVGTTKTEYSYNYINGYSNKSCFTKVYKQHNQLNIIVAGQLNIDPSTFVSGSVQTFLEFTLDEETSRKLFVGDSNTAEGSIASMPGTYYNDINYQTTVVPFIIRRTSENGNTYVIRFTGSGLTTASTLTDVNWRIALSLD